MKKKNDNIKLDLIEKKDPFKIPENYFTDVVADIMSKLPDRSVEQPKTIGLREKVQPWIYMATLFAGIALMVNLCVGKPDSGKGKNAGQQAIREMLHKHRK
jgi:hypothetical protein